MSTLPAPGDGRSIPAPRPHFHLRGEALYFLISRRPYVALAERERAVWEAMDGAVSLDDLSRRCGAGTDAVVRRFWELGLCELIPPRFPAGRRQILVIEPHMDDAALSIGGTLWRRRQECEFTVLTVAGRSNYSSYGHLDREYFDADVVTRLRLAESVLFVRALGGRHLSLDKLEATQRYRPGTWSLDWYRRHRQSVSAFISHRSSEPELAEWTLALREALRAHAADEVWFPIGVGPHTDHELTRNACLAALLAEPELRRGRTFRLYEEVPYAAQFPDYTRVLAATLTQAGARLAPEAVPVTEVFAEKLRLVSIFGSQFKLEALRPGIEAAARAAAGPAGGFAERFFTLDEPPRALDPLSLYLHAERVRALARRLRPWLAKHRRTRRLRVLLRFAAGRWREDADLLLRAFPQARIEAHAAPLALAELQDHPSDRITVRSIGEGAPAWVRRAAGLAWSAPAPTIFVAGEDREREAAMLSRLFPLSPTVVVPTMNLLAQGLAAAAQGRPE